jgi:hypothetical protein
MTVQSPPPAPPTAPPPPPPRKSGALKWILLGCGLFLVLILGAMGYCTIVAKRKFGEFKDNPAMATAKMVVAANPELELVSEDKEAGTLTIRNKTTGEVVTVGLDDIKEGKIDFKTAEGETSMEVGEEGIKISGAEGQTTFQTGAVENVPDWIPAYPNGTTQPGYSATTAEGRQAAFTVTTSDPVDRVLSFYEEKLRAAGLTVEKAEMTAGDQRSGTVSGRSADDARQVSVMVSTSDEGTQALVSFTEKQ